MSNMQTENPYSAPESAIQGGESRQKRGSGKSYVFRPADGLAKGVFIAIGINIATMLLDIAAAFHERQLLSAVQDGGTAIEDIREAVDAAGLWVGAGSGLFLISLLACYVIGGMWIYRAACNVRALGADDLDDSPGWAVGWYAIPFANLVRPFRAMRQIWLASEAPHDWDDGKKPPLLSIWWALFVIDCIVGNISGRIGNNETIDGLITSQDWLMVAFLTGIPAAVAFVMVVSRITRLQAKTEADFQPMNAQLSDNPVFASP
jgi:hypothetical protein